MTVNIRAESDAPGTVTVELHSDRIRVGILAGTRAEGREITTDLDARTARSLGQQLLDHAQQLDEAAGGSSAPDA